MVQPGLGRGVHLHAVSEQAEQFSLCVGSERVDEKHCALTPRTTTSVFIPGGGVVGDDGDHLVVDLAHVEVAASTRDG